MLCCDPGGAVRSSPPPGVLLQGPPAPSHPPPISAPNGTPVAIQHQVKMLPPTNVLQMRICPTAVYVRPSFPFLTSLQAVGNNPTPPVPSVPPQLPCVTQHPMPAITNGVGCAATTMLDLEAVKVGSSCLCRLHASPFSHSIFSSYSRSCLADVYSISQK
jgi:hypothetical protein